MAAARGWNDKGSRGTALFASLVGYPTVGVNDEPPPASTASYDEAVREMSAWLAPAQQFEAKATVRTSPA